MEKILRYIIENTASEKIDKDIAIEILKMLKSKGSRYDEDIAVIGLSIRMPSAENIEEYWKNIKNCKDCISSIPSQRRNDIENYFRFKNFNYNDIEYVDSAYLERIDHFDYNFFGLSPKEASLMDPCQRIFLQTAWNALEDAGYCGKRLAGSRTGIYLGYGRSSVYKDFVADLEPSSIPAATSGNIPAIIASRIAYILDLKGPSLLVDTACSSSLVAIHLACQGIKNGDCSMAIAGSVKINLLPIKSRFKLGIESTDGRTKAFDDYSDGTGSGEGAAAIVLKPLSEAIKSRDHIYAIIKGSSVNQDGNTAGITAPNPAAQMDVIIRAWKDAKIDPETISYIEAHGTGTKLGDPIEIDGIQRAFRKYTSKMQFCAIGSVKTNIGHLDYASGIAGVVKAILALNYKELPPTLFFNKPNSKIQFEHSPVYVNDRTVKWEGETPRRCGVSSFGLSGTNCHIVLEEAPEPNKKDGNLDGKFILALSAKSKEALVAMVDRYINYSNQTTDNFRDICFTANTGRGHYNWRLAFVINCIEDLKNKLSIAKQVIGGKTDFMEVFFGEYKVISPMKPKKERGEITEEQLREISLAANEQLRSFVESGRKNEEILYQICKKYVMGADIEWDELFKEQNASRIRLPVYPFEKRRCWVEVPKALNDVNDNMFYSTRWELCEADNVPRRSECETILTLIGAKGAGDLLVKSLKEKGNRIIELRLGNEFRKVNENSFIVTGNETDYIKVLNELNNDCVGKIIHLCTLDVNDIKQNISELEDSLQNGVLSLFRLTKALTHHNISHKIDIVLVSRYADEVDGTESCVIPENQALFGLGKIIGMEHRNLTCRCIDIDDKTDIEIVLSEIYALHDDYKIAFRSGRRYVEEIDVINIPSVKERLIRLKEDGVYIITGGAGGIGLEIACYLAAKGKVNLALINRHPICPKKEWENVLMSEKDEKLIHKINKIKSIEKLGSTVISLCADVSNEHEMECAIHQLKSKFKKINGIIHCAGIPGNGFIFRKDEKAFCEVLSPKIKGAWILNHLTKSENLDFFIMFSSVASILGGVGQGDYTAANAYLDSFEAFLRKCGRTALTINWAAWKETGMAADNKVNVDGVFKAITTQKAIDAFDIVLNKDLSRVLVGELSEANKLEIATMLPVNLGNQIKSRLQKNSIRAVDESNGKPKEILPEVRIKGRESIDDYSKTEILLAKVWGKVLGLEEINIYDDFFELGGHSILAVKVEAELENYNISLDSTKLYEYPTIRGLAEFINNMEVQTIPGKAKSVIDEKSMHKQDVEICNIEPFNDLFYKSCFYNSLFPVINHFNKDIMPVLTNDIILYDCNEESTIKIDIVYKPIKPIETLLGDQGIKINTKDHVDDVVESLVLSIDYGRPVIIWVDSYYEPIRADVYHKTHWEHTLLVYGYNKKKRYFKIIEHDNKEKLSYRHYTISFEDLENCFEGYLSNFYRKEHFPIYNEFFLDEISENCCKNSKSNIVSLADNMISNKSLIISSMVHLKDFICYFEEIIAVNEKPLKVINEIVNMFSNIINARKVELYRLERVQNQRPEVCNLLEEIITEWNIVRSKLAKVLFSSDINHKSLYSVSDKLRKIYDLEVKSYNELFRYLRGL